MKLSTFELFKHLPTEAMQFVEVSGETLKRLQQVLCDMAADVIETCDENGIYYQLSGGTALGAVRHKGFIPWDDDIDINILSSDLQKLKKCIRKKYGDKYIFQTYDDPDYGIIPSKIRLRNSVARGREDLHSKECGITIDLFAIENTFDNSVLRNIHGLFCMGFGFLLSCRNFYKNRDFMRQCAKQMPDAAFVFKIKTFIGFLLSFLSVQRLAIITNSCYGLCKNKRSKYVCIPSGRKHFFGELYRRRGMLKTIKLPFEGHQWNVAKDYHSYFLKLYGADYMTIPPKEKRETHALLELKFPEDILEGGKSK